MQIKKFQLKTTGDYLNRGLNISLPRTKLHDRINYAIKRTWSKIKDQYEDLLDEENNIRREYALEGPNKELLRDAQGRFQYSKDGDKACQKALQDLYNETVDVDIYQIDDDIALLDPNNPEVVQVRSYIIGVIIKEATPYIEGESEEDYLKRRGTYIPPVGSNHKALELTTH